MFDRIAPVYDLMNRVMTAGLDQRWRRKTVEGGRPARRPRARRGLRHRRPGDHRREGGRRRDGPRLLGADARARAAQGARARVDPRRPARAAVRGRVLRLGDGRLRHPQRRRPPGGDRASCAASCDRAAGSAILEITRPRGPLRFFYSLWFDRVVPLLGKLLPGGEAYTYLPASVRRFPGPDELAAQLEHGLPRRRVPASSPADRRAAHWSEGMTAALTEIRTAPGPRRVPRRARGAARARGRGVPGRRRRGREGVARGRRQAAAAAARLPERAADARRAARGGRRGRAAAHGDARARRPDRRRRGSARPRVGLVRARRRRRARDRRLPVRACVRRAAAARQPRARCRSSRTRRSASSAARRCSGGSRTTPRRPSTPTSSAAR